MTTRKHETDDVPPGFLRCGVCGHVYKPPVCDDDGCPVCFPHREET